MGPDSSSVDVAVAEALTVHSTGLHNHGPFFSYIKVQAAEDEENNLSGTPGQEYIKIQLSLPLYLSDC